MQESQSPRIVKRCGYSSECPSAHKPVNITTYRYNRQATGGTSPSTAARQRLTCACPVSTDGLDRPRCDLHKSCPDSMPATGHSPQPTAMSHGMHASYSVRVHDVRRSYTAMKPCNNGHSDTELTRTAVQLLRLFFPLKAETCLSFYGWTWTCICILLLFSIAKTQTV